MVPSINSPAPNPLIAYQTTPIAPVAPVPGSSQGTGDSDPATQHQTELEARIQDFENYLNGVVSDAPANATTSPASSVDAGDTPGPSLIADFEAQVQNFEAYLNQGGLQPATTGSEGQGADGSSASAGSIDTEQVLETFIAAQLLAAANGSTSQSTATQASSSTTGSTPALTKPIDLGAIVNAVERFLSKQGPAAISDPIQGQSTTPIPLYQTVQGRQDPLPVDGQEQASKTDAQQSEKSHDSSTRDLVQKLEDLAILNLLANKKSLEFDPVRDLENKSIYKAPGETSPI